MQRILVVLLVAVLSVSAAIFATFAQAQSSTQPAATPVPAPEATVTPSPEELAAAEIKRKAEHRVLMIKARNLRKKVQHYRARTWYWRSVMQKHNKRRPFFAHASRNIPRLKYLVKVWKKRFRRASWQAHHPPMLWAWLCIHRHEGPWNSNTNPKYDGGLQMDYIFQRMYGARWLRLKGPAYNWTMWEQIWSAVRAWRSRYFSPWPNTRKPCHV
jgi:hypothetical protein